MFGGHLNSCIPTLNTHLHSSKLLLVDIYIYSWFKLNKKKTQPKLVADEFYWFNTLTYRIITMLVLYILITETCISSLILCLFFEVQT